jgi:hypothetical protein
MAMASVVAVYGIFHMGWIALVVVAFALIAYLVRGRSHG